MRRLRHPHLHAHALSEVHWQKFRNHPQYNKLLIYSWLLVIAVVFIGTVIDGTGFSFGVFFKFLESDLGLNRAMLSIIFAISVILSSVFGFIGGWALDKYGPRRILFIMGVFTAASLLLTSQVQSSWQIFITYSLLLAIGTGPVYAVTNSIVMRTFKKEQGLVIGIANAGEGLGLIIMAPVATLLIASFDWRMAYIIIGLVALVTVIPVSLLVKQTPQESVAGAKGIELNTKASPTSEGLSIARAAKTRSFWLFALIGVLMASGIHLIITHIIPYTTDIGHTEEQAAVMLSLIGIGTITGGILMGLVCDKLGQKKTSVSSCLLLAVALFWLISATPLWSLYLFAFVFGFAFGGVLTALTALVGHSFGVANIGKMLGVLDLSFGVAALAGPLLAGIIYDAGHDYTPAFIFAAVSALVATLLVTQIRCETEYATTNGGIVEKIASL